MTTALMPMPKLQFFDNNGHPLSGGLLYTAVPGTNAGPGQSSPKATYTDSTGVTQNANPVVLDTAGRASVWGIGTYKMALYDSNGTLIYAQDNMSPIVATDAGAAHLSAANVFTALQTFTDTITKGPVVDARVFMDGQSGRPTLAQWQAAETTLDMSSVIQAAIDYSAFTAGYPEVFFSPGTWCYKHIQIHYGTRIRGAGKAATFFKVLTSANAWTMEIDAGPVCQVSVQDLRFDGCNQLNQGWFNVKAVVDGSGTGGMWYSDMRNLYVDNFDGIGLWLQGGVTSGNLPNQFIDIQDVQIFVNHRLGNRALKLTGQCGQINFIGGEYDSIGATYPSLTVGTMNIEVARDTTVAPPYDNAPYFVDFIGVTSQGADLGIQIDRAANIGVKIYFENIFRAITTVNSSTGVIVGKSRFANAGSDGAGGGYLVNIGGTSSGKVDGCHVTGAYDNAWVGNNSGFGLVEGDNFFDTTPIVSRSANTTKQTGVAGDGSITIQNFKTVYVNASATPLTTITSDVGVGQSLTMLAGGAFTIATGGNITIPGGVTSVNIGVGEALQFTRFDLGGTWVLISHQYGQLTVSALTTTEPGNANPSQNILEAADSGPRLNQYRYSGTGVLYYETAIGNTLTGAGNGSIAFKTGTGAAAIGTDTLTVRMEITQPGIVKMTFTPNYASNAAAITGGLAVGSIYRNGDVLQIVH